MEQLEHSRRQVLVTLYSSRITGIMFELYTTPKYLTSNADSVTWSVISSTTISDLLNAESVDSPYSDL